MDIPGGLFAFRKESIMVELYKFDMARDEWVFVRYGHPIFAQMYATNGYLVVHIKGGHHVEHTEQRKAS